MTYPAGVLQDVSEFQHRLLEWLEDAFRTQPGATTPGASPQQPSAGAMPGPTSDVTPGTTPGASPQQTSAGATSGVTAAATPAATPGVTPAATPGATSRASPQQRSAAHYSLLLAHVSIDVNSVIYNGHWHVVYHQSASCENSVWLCSKLSLMLKIIYIDDVQ